MLRIEIVQIKTRDYAVMCVERGAGALGEFIDGIETSILPIRSREAGVQRIPVRSGQPDDRRDRNRAGRSFRPERHAGRTWREHGLQTDHRGHGAVLPVNVEGALLSVGDLHAVMGDGEVCICGAEVSGEVTLKARTQEAGLPTPCLETAGHFTSSARP